MLDEGFACWEASGICYLNHFRTDSCDFLQANLVDLVSGKIGRGFLANAELIISGTAGLCRNTWQLCAGGFIAFDIPIELLFESRVDDRANRRNGLLCERVESFLADALGPFARIRREIT